MSSPPAVSLRIRGPAPPLRGRIAAPGDKSITHRALLLAALARGESTVHGALDCDDTRATRAALEALGARIETVATVAEGGAALALLRVTHGIDHARSEPVALHCRASGATARMILGVVAPLSRPVVVDGDPALRRRPMERLVAPLEAMGVRFEGVAPRALPLHVHGAPLRGREHRLDVASAQVLSALLLAGASAAGRTRVVLPLPARDHTQRMLRRFGVDVREDDGGRAASLDGGTPLRGCAVRVPGDPSSALALGAAALAVPGSAIEVTGVCVNPTRTGAFDVLCSMGAGPAPPIPACGPDDEPRADVAFRAVDLAGTEVAPAEFPRLLDEVPLLCALAAFARGRTRIAGAAELRAKESDRIAAIVAVLRAFGVRVASGADWIEIEGGPLHPARVDSAGDHRIAFAAVVLALRAKGTSEIGGVDAVAKSYPRFVDDLCELLPEGGRGVVTRIA